ncbi:MAG: hypothetical protein ACI304_01255 [Lepagella sp.]
MNILKFVGGLAVVVMAGSTAYADEASVREFRDKSEAKAYLQEINVGATCDQTHIADSIFIVNYRVDYPYRYEDGERVRLIVEPKDGEGVRELFSEPKITELEAGGIAGTRQTWRYGLKIERETEFTIPSAVFAIPRPDGSGEVDTLRYDFNNRISFHKPRNKSEVQQPIRIPKMKELWNRFSLVCRPEKKVYAPGETVVCEYRLVYMSPSEELTIGTLDFYGQSLGVKIHDKKYRIQTVEDAEWEPETNDGKEGQSLLVGRLTFTPEEAGGYTIPSVECITTLDVDFIKQEGEWKRTKTIKLTDLELATKKVKIKVKD